MTFRTKKTHKTQVAPASRKRQTVAQGTPRKAAGVSGTSKGRRISGLKGVGLIREGGAQKLELRARLQMPRPIFGKIVNVAERTIASVEAGNLSIDKLKRPYNEVYRLCEALSEVVDPACLGQWFLTHNDSLDGLTPLEVIEQGEIDQLWNMVFELQTGMPG